MLQEGCDNYIDVTCLSAPKVPVSSVIAADLLRMPGRGSAITNRQAHEDNVDSSNSQERSDEPILALEIALGAVEPAETDCRVTFAAFSEFRLVSIDWPLRTNECVDDDQDDEGHPAEDDRDPSSEVGEDHAQPDVPGIR